MYTTIYLIRHSKVDFIHDEYSRPLSENGKSSVLKLTEMFKDHKVSKVISSPYIRAIHTIENIAKDKGLIVGIMDDFRERTVASKNIELDDFIAFTKNQWDNFDYHLEDGESLNEVQHRGINALNEVLKKYKGENIIIGTHGTILGAILNYFDKKYNYEFWKSMKMPDVFKLTFNDNGSLESIINLDIIN